MELPLSSTLSNTKTKINLDVIYGKQIKMIQILVYTLILGENCVMYNDFNKLDSPKNLNITKTVFVSKTYDLQNNVGNFKNSEKRFLQKPKQLDIDKLRNA